MARRRSGGNGSSNANGKGSPPPLSSVGEELLELADRAGLAPHHCDELRQTMAVWCRRYRLRSPGGSEDAALVALTVSYLRKFRDED